MAPARGRPLRCTLTTTGASALAVKPAVSRIARTPRGRQAPRARRDPRWVAAARGAARAERREPGRRSHHDVRRLDAVRLPAHRVVRELDRLGPRELSVRVAHDDRVARGDLPVDL